MTPQGTTPIPPRSDHANGQLDTRLNENGKEQARLLGEALRSTTITHAYTSPLQRAYDTSKFILAHHPSITLIEDPRLTERHLGDLQGKIRRRSYVPQNMETKESVATRSLDFWDAHILPLARDNHGVTHKGASSDDPSSDSEETTDSDTEDLPTATIMIVGHSSSLNHMMKTLITKRGYDSNGWELDGLYNTSVSTFEVYPNGKGKLINYSAIDHLDDFEDMTDTNADDI